MNKVRVLAACAFAACICSTEAAHIDGFIEFTSDPSKSVTVIGPNLAGATGLDFQPGPNAFVQDTVSGDFAAEFPGTATFNDFNFGGAADPLWSLTSGNFSFALDTSAKTVYMVAGITFLNISGTGTVTGAGFEPTPGEFSFTISSSRPERVNFGWQSTMTAIPIPDAGSTSILLGIGLLGAAGLRRKVG